MYGVECTGSADGARRDGESGPFCVCAATASGSTSRRASAMRVIALAVARNARLVVMDEPTASLNAEEIEHVGETVRQLRARGVAVLVSELRWIWAPSALIVVTGFAWQHFRRRAGSVQ